MLHYERVTKGKTDGKQNPSAYAKTGFKLKFRRGELNETNAPKGVESFRKKAKLILFQPSIDEPYSLFQQEERYSLISQLLHHRCGMSNQRI